MSTFDSLLQKRRKLKDLFPKILHARTADEQEDLFACTKALISGHMASEEKDFYKILSPKNRTLKNKIAYARNGHDEIRHFLTVLEKNHISYEEWVFTLGELKHALSCHLHIEEEIFVLAKKTMKNNEFLQLIKRVKQAEQRTFKDLLGIWAAAPA